MVLAESVKIASAPHSGLSVTRQRGWRPPTHTSVKSTLLPSLLNVAECQKEKFESDTAPIRFGFAASRMSSRRPYPPHAPPGRPIAGYTVISWQCVGRGLGVPGGRGG